MKNLKSVLIFDYIGVWQYILKQGKQGKTVLWIKKKPTTNDLIDFEQFCKKYLIFNLVAFS